MYNHVYDPEAVIQDADIEQAEFEEYGRRLSSLARRGICTHGSWVGVSATGEIFYPEQEGLLPGQVRCTDMCRKVFESDDDLIADRTEMLNFG